MERITDLDLIPGYIYTFNSKADCNEGEAWGIFDKMEGDILIMEVMTFDMEYFLPKRCLPSKYKYAREARHEEIRDFAFNYGAFFPLT